MPRPTKGARLTFDEERRKWVIRDGAIKRRTGFGESERAGAEEALARYLVQKYEPVRDNRPAKVRVDDVLDFYVREVAPAQRSRLTTSYAVESLLRWWSGKPLSEVRRSTCQAYVDWRCSQTISQARYGDALEIRVSVSTASRELTMLRAAIRAYHAENTLDAVPIVTLPAAAAPRTRWLTRSEAAAFLRAARRHPERPARTALIRFFLIAVYTGTRSGAVRSLCWVPNTMGGWIDLDAGVMHRRAEADAESKKRRPRARIPRRLLGHLSRWRRIDAAAPRSVEQGAIKYVVHSSGEPLASQRKPWEWVRTRAGLDDEVVPHVLRHTAATWMMQAGAEPWDAAGYLGMSPEMLWEVYGHHHPDFQGEIADKIGRKPKRLGQLGTETSEQKAKVPVPSSSKTR